MNRAQVKIGNLIFRTDKSNQTGLDCNDPVVHYEYLGDWGANSERYPNRDGDECFICGTRALTSSTKYVFPSFSNWCVVTSIKDYDKRDSGEECVRYLGTECANKLRKYLKSQSLNPKDYILENTWGGE